MASRCRGDQRQRRNPRGRGAAALLRSGAAAACGGRRSQERLRSGRATPQPVEVTETVDDLDVVAVFLALFFCGGRLFLRVGGPREGTEGRHTKHEPSDFMSNE